MPASRIKTVPRELQEEMEKRIREEYAFPLGVNLYETGTADYEQRMKRTKIETLNNMAEEFLRNKKGEDAFRCYESINLIQKKGDKAFSVSISPVNGSEIPDYLKDITKDMNPEDAEYMMRGFNSNYSDSSLQSSSSTEIPEQKTFEKTGKVIGGVIGGTIGLTAGILINFALIYRGPDTSRGYSNPIKDVLEITLVPAAGMGAGIYVGSKVGGLIGKGIDKTGEVVYEKVKRKKEEVNNNQKDAVPISKYVWSADWKDCQRQSSSAPPRKSIKTPAPILSKYKNLEFFDKVLEKNPRDKNAWINKGVILDELGLHKNSIKCYEKALEIDPDYRLARKNKRAALEKLKRKNKRRGKLDENKPSRGKTEKTIKKNVYTAKKETEDWNEIEFFD